MNRLSTVTTTPQHPNVDLPRKTYPVDLPKPGKTEVNPRWQWVIQDCLICLRHGRVNQCYRGHTFCNDCEEKDECPVCKLQLTPEQDHDCDTCFAMATMECNLHDTTCYSCDDCWITYSGCAACAQESQDDCATCGEPALVMCTSCGESHCEYHAEECESADSPYAYRERDG